MLSAVFSKGGQKTLALARKRKRNIGGKEWKLKEKE